MSIPFPPGHRMFFVRALCEPAENELRVVVTEATAAEPQTEIFLGEAVETASIDVDPASPSIELTWQDYVSYAVQADRYYLPEGEHPPGSMLRERQESPFLDYVGATTFAADMVGRLRHWELSCMMHVIHVVAERPPLVRHLSGGDFFPLR